MNIIIVSLHFSPGFIGHMKAWYMLCERSGYNAIIYFDKQYLPFFDENEYKCIVNISDAQQYHPHIAIVQNTGFENISFFKWCTKSKCKLIYILHEPYMGMKEMIKDGNYFAKQAVACGLNVWLCHKSTKVILCSKYAEQNCKKYMKRAANKACNLPLLFLDEYDQKNKDNREYFSMIGTCAESHGSDIFISYIRHAYEKGYKQKFQIVTRSDISNRITDPVYKKMQDEGQLIIKQGRPLSEEEMSIAYRQSIATWNGYRRSTQSGVLPNAFMHGTPVVATRLGSFEEFVLPGRTGVFIDDFEYDTITNALETVRRAGDVMNNECRNYFLKFFYYNNQVDSFRTIIESLENDVE